MLGLAAEVAHEAGDLLLEHSRSPAREVQAKSTPTDLVSAADLAAEGLIRDRLASARPGDAVLGEEGGQIAGADTGADDLRWVVDPLDGTTNFLFGIPQWCVSIACEDAAGTMAAAVFDPSRDETFTATRGGAAACNGVALTASACADLSRALVATGFAYDATVRARQATVAAALLPRVRDIRRLGSAALDLCWTAAGRYDAYYERGVQPWDIAAGALICERAGLEVGELPGADGMPSGLFAAPQALIARLSPLIRAPS